MGLWGRHSRGQAGGGGGGVEAWRRGAAKGADRSDGWVEEGKEEARATLQQH